MKLSERILKIVFATAAVVSIVAVLLICVFLFANSVPAIEKIGLIDFLVGRNWKPSQNIYGIFPMIIGSIYVTAGATIIGVPTGFLTATFLAKFCPDKLYNPLKTAVNLLAGIPSVVYGFFGLVVVVPLVQKLTGTSGKSILTASIILGIMILPTIINVAESSISAVDDSYYQGALALGATHERAVFATVCPAAKSGVFAGIVLGIGRAIGEAMAVSMIAGNQPVIPNGILSGVRTLTSNIVIEMGYAADLHRDALIATAAVLFVFIMIINIAFSLLKKGGVKR